MALLKSLIQRLLDSRTTPSEAAHSAMPQENQVINYGSTTENPGSWTTILSFTAPKDGYAKAVVVGTGKNSAELYCGNMRVSAFAPVDNASINVVMPVRKGASVGLVSTVFRSAALYFVPSIGGYNHFVRRALSCLRALSNCLQKVFSRAKRRGYLSGRSNCLTQRQSLRYQRQTLGQSSQCRLTVGQLLKVQTILQRRLTATFVKGNIKCSVFASVVSPTALQQFLFSVKKVKPSALPFTQTVRTSPLEHLKHFHLANLQTRGASC